MFHYCLIYFQQGLILRSHLTNQNRRFQNLLFYLRHLRYFRYHLNYYRYFESIKVDVVDTTGAGDVFNAALTTMLKDHSIEEAIEFAVRASALSVCKPYVMNAIPTKKEVEEYKK